MFTRNGEVGLFVYNHFLNWMIWSKIFYQLENFGSRINKIVCLHFSWLYPLHKKVSYASSTSQNGNQNPSCDDICFFSFTMDTCFDWSIMSREPKLLDGKSRDNVLYNKYTMWYTKIREIPIVLLTWRWSCTFFPF